MLPAENNAYRQDVLFSAHDPYYVRNRKLTAGQEAHAMPVIEMLAMLERFTDISGKKSTGR